MQRFVSIILPIALLAIASAQERPQRSFNPYVYSAASQSQIKNAIENNYDDTGPGSKNPEQAFKTFNTLEDALLNYLDDPDTKLPDHERAKAVQRLVRPDLYDQQPVRHLPQITNEYPKIRPITNHLSQGEALNSLNKFGYSPNGDIYNQYLTYLPNLHFRAVEANNLGLQNVGAQSYAKQISEPLKLHTIQAVKSNPVSLAHYTKTQEAEGGEFNPNPHYSFSYGVHDKQTGDSKSAHEVRSGGVVRGYYSFMDADGKRRTVRYTADDKQGFRASVERTGSDAAQ